MGHSPIKREIVGVAWDHASWHLAVAAEFTIPDHTLLSGSAEGRDAAQVIWSKALTVLWTSFSPELLSSLQEQNTMGLLRKKTQHEKTSKETQKNPPTTQMGKQLQMLICGWITKHTCSTQMIIKWQHGDYCNFIFNCHKGRMNISLMFLCLFDHVIDELLSWWEIRFTNQHHTLSQFSSGTLTPVGSDLDLKVKI